MSTGHRDKRLKHDLHSQVLLSGGEENGSIATVVVMCPRESRLDGLRNDFRKVEVYSVGTKELENSLY